MQVYIITLCYFCLPNPTSLSFPQRGIHEVPELSLPSRTSMHLTSRTGASLQISEDLDPHFEELSPSPSRGSPGEAGTRKRAQDPALQHRMCQRRACARLPWNGVITAQGLWRKRSRNKFTPVTAILLWLGKWLRTPSSLCGISQLAGHDS